MPEYKDIQDDEIVKALKLCSSNGPYKENCPNCSFNAKSDAKSAYCVKNMLKATIDLINRLNIKNEILEVNKKAFAKGMKREKEKADTIKSEAIKEFSERLKAVITLNNTNDGCLDCAIDYGCLIEDIDELVKEMVNENNL